MEKSTHPALHCTKNNWHSSESIYSNPIKDWDGEDFFRDELLDVEHFLEDLGFAGSTDPPIPERFLPSLLHRITTMPRTALWYLNHRILQALLMHRRKEQRRRLFRYASVGNKEVLERRSQFLNLLQNQPSGEEAKKGNFVRALTGPADFSEETVPSTCQSTKRFLAIPHSEKVPEPNVPETNCPISIYVDAPDNESHLSQSCDVDVKINVPVNKIEIKESTKTNLLSFNTISDRPVSRLSDRHLRKTLTRSFSKFPKDQRRMILQRNPAVLKTRSASEPVLFQLDLNFDNNVENTLDTLKNSNRRLETTNLSSPLLVKNEEFKECSNSIPYFWFRNNLFHNSRDTYINVWPKYTINEDKQVIRPIARGERPFFTRQCQINDDLFPSLKPFKMKRPFLFRENHEKIFKISLHQVRALLGCNMHELCNIIFSKLNLTSIFDIVNVTMPKMHHSVDCSFQSKHEALKNAFSVLCQFSGNLKNAQYMQMLYAFILAFLCKEANIKCRYSRKNQITWYFSETREIVSPFIISLKNQWNYNSCDKVSTFFRSEKDNTHFVNTHTRKFCDNGEVFELNETPPTVITFTMSKEIDNKLVEDSNAQLFLSGLSVNVGQDGASTPYFKSAVSFRLQNVNQDIQSQDVLSTKAAENDEETNVRHLKSKEPPSHSFFRKATQELMELREFIQKAKITRESASSELRQIQGALQSPSGINIEHACDKAVNGVPSEQLNISSNVKNTSSELQRTFRRQVGEISPNSSSTIHISANEEIKISDESSTQSGERQVRQNLRRLRKNLLRVEQRHMEDMTRVEKELQFVRNECSDEKRRYWDKVDALQFMVLQLQKDILRFQEAIAELQKQAKMREASTPAYIEKEIRGQIQVELEQEWKSRISTMEDKLRVAEEELSILREENEQLRRQLLHSSMSDSSFSPSMISNNKSAPLANGFVPNGPTIPKFTKEQNNNEKKLLDELRETEERADRLNLMLDQKLVELNRLQLALSKRAKEMVLLEKAYLQLRCYLYKNNRPLKEICRSPKSLSPNNKSSEDPP